jgi:hypothetical protein
MTASLRSTSQKTNQAALRVRSLKFKIIPAPEKLKAETDFYNS